MPLRSISIAEFNQNLRQHLNQITNRQPLKITQTPPNQDLVILTADQYQRLVDQQLPLTLTRQERFVKTLGLIDQLNNNDIFFTIGTNLLMSTFRELTPFNAPIIYQQSNELIGCVSGYLLRANGQTLNLVNLKALSKRPLNQLIQIAQRIQPHNSLYQDVIGDCVTQLNKMAPNPLAQQALMAGYRALLS